MLKIDFVEKRRCKVLVLEWFLKFKSGVTFVEDAGSFRH
jgi:hypothetical protein